MTARTIRFVLCMSHEYVEREGGTGYDNALALDPFSSLQRSVFMSGRGFSYFAETPGLPLSLKCMFNGRALYRFGRAEVAVDDRVI